MIAWVHVFALGQTITITSPGWTFGGQSPDGSAAWAWCQYDGSQPPNVTWKWTTSAQFHAQVILARNQGVGVAPAIGVNAANSGFGTNIFVSHLVTTDDLSLIIAIMLVNVNTVIPTPPGFVTTPPISYGEPPYYHDSNASWLISNQQFTLAGSITSDLNTPVPAGNWSGFLIEVTAV